MSLLNIELSGLKRLAADCEAWSEEVAVSGAPAVPATSVQATAAAVELIHAGTRSTGRALSARMLASAASLSATARAFTTQDGDAAVELDELANGR